MSLIRIDTHIYAGQESLSCLKATFASPHIVTFLGRDKLVPLFLVKGSADQFLPDSLINKFGLFGKLVLLVHLHSKL